MTAGDRSGRRLDNFRNIAHAELSFSPAFNLITGRNAQGKTNLLEAIYLFSLGRSFRTRTSTRRSGSARSISSRGSREGATPGVDFTIEAGAERGGRTKVSSNGRKASGLAEIVGIIPGVIFVAEDILLASGPPAGRRAYLDYTAAQISPQYLRGIKEYRGALRQRNALLERAAREAARPRGSSRGTRRSPKKGGRSSRCASTRCGSSRGGRARSLDEEILGDTGAIRRANSLLLQLPGQGDRARRSRRRRSRGFGRRSGAGLRDG